MSRKMKVVIGLVVVLVVAGGVWLALGSGGEKVTVIEDVVRKGDLRQTVEVTGTVRAASDVELAFEAAGTVRAVNIDVGDAVTAGEELATLRADDLGADLSRAEAVLDKLLEGASSEDEAVAQAAVAVAQAAYDAAVADVALVQAETEASVAQAQAAYDAAEDDRVDAEADSVRNVAQAQADYADAMQSAIIDVRAGLAEADEVLGVENTLLNNTFEGELAAGDPNLLGAAQRAFRTAMDARDDAEAQLEVFVQTDTAALVETGAVVDEALDAASEAMLLTSQVLDATFADSASLPLATLLAMKTSVNAARQSVQGAASALLAAAQAYESAVAGAASAQIAADNAVTAAARALAAAEAARDRAVVQADAAVATSAADLARAQASLAQTTASARAADIRAAQADVRAAQARYAKAVITSPIDGVVTEVLVDAGEQLVAGSVAVRVAAVDGQFEIAVNIPESDIAGVAVGQTADIVLDAFGDDMVFAATVGRVDPAETVIEGVTFYEAVLYFAETPAGVKPGMSADVTILTGERTQTLYIPQRAVLESGTRRYVRIATDANGGYTERDVTVGMRGDDGLLEVLSGVTEGERVIVSLR